MLGFVSRQEEGEPSVAYEKDIEHDSSAAPMLGKA